MPPKQKKPGFDFIEEDQDGDDAVRMADQESLSQEYPISEGSDESARQAERLEESDIRDAVKQSDQEVKRRLSAVVDRGFEASSGAIEGFEDGMSARPWSTFVAGVLLGGIAGYLIASRR